MSLIAVSKPQHNIYFFQTHKNSDHVFSKIEVPCDRYSLVEFQPVNYFPISVRLPLSPQLSAQVFLNRPATWFRKTLVYLNFNDTIKSLGLTINQRGAYITIANAKTKTSHEYFSSAPENTLKEIRIEIKKSGPSLTCEITFLGNKLRHTFLPLNVKTKLTQKGQE